LSALTANTTGAGNTVVGRIAGDAITTANSNCCFGNSAGGALTTGHSNITIGESSANATVALTTGAANTVIGHEARTAAAGTNTSNVIGYQVTGVGNDNTTFGIGTNDSNIAAGATTITAPSDGRLKEDIQDEEIGLDFINDLRPVTFRWKKEKDCPSHMRVYKENSEERVMNGKYNHGFIAQEVKKVIDNHNLKDGFDMWTEDELDGRQRVGEAALMPLMVKAVQELSAKVEELESKLNGE
jgi:hypothetical protein